MYRDVLLQFLVYANDEEWTDLVREADFTLLSSKQDCPETSGKRTQGRFKVSTEITYEKTYDTNHLI